METQNFWVNEFQEKQFSLVSLFGLTIELKTYSNLRSFLFCRGQFQIKSKTSRYSLQ